MTYDIENVSITFAKTKEIEEMNPEQTEIYLDALKELEKDIRDEIEYVDAFGNKAWEQKEE